VSIAGFLKDSRLNDSPSWLGTAGIKRVAELDGFLIIRPPGQRGDLYLRTVGQFRVGRQHHHAILDCTFQAHADCLTQKARERKPTPGRSGAAGWECGVGRFATLTRSSPPLISGRGSHSAFFILPAAFNERSRV